MKYAADTEVSVEKSRAELETILTRYGATCFGYMTDERRAVIGFRIKNRAVKFTLPLPDRNDKRFKMSGHVPPRLRHSDDAYKAWEQSCRSMWRSLVLCVKAKLEAVTSGITTFDAEFLAHFVLSDGRTYGELALPTLDTTIQTGNLPLLLTAGGEE